MAKNTNNVSMDEDTSTLPDELFQLRDILFGEDKREFEAHFQALEDKTNQQLDQLNASFHSEISELKQSMDKSFALLSERLNDQDHLHSERENELQDFADSTLNKLTSFEKQTKKTTDDIVAKINRESNSLNKSFNEQLQQTLDKLEQVSNSLQSNKADRKLLAQLLTSAAQELTATDD